MKPTSLRTLLLPFILTWTCLSTWSQPHVGFGVGFSPQYGSSTDAGVDVPALLPGCRGYVELGYALRKHFRFAVTGGVGYQRYKHRFNDGHVPLSHDVIDVSTQSESAFYYFNAQILYFKRVTRRFALSFGAGPTFNNTQLDPTPPNPIMPDSASMLVGAYYENTNIDKTKDWNAGLTLNLDFEFWLGKKGHAMYANLSHEAYFKPQVFWDGRYTYRSSTQDILFEQQTSVKYRGNRFNLEIGYRYYFRTKNFRRWSSYSGR